MVLNNILNADSRHLILNKAQFQYSNLLVCHCPYVPSFFPSCTEKGKKLQWDLVLELGSKKECNCTENFQAYPLQDLQFGLVRQRMDGITFIRDFPVTRNWISCMAIWKHNLYQYVENENYSCCIAYKTDIAEAVELLVDGGWLQEPTIWYFHWGWTVISIFDMLHNIWFKTFQISNSLLGPNP